MPISQEALNLFHKSLLELDVSSPLEGFDTLYDFQQEAAQTLSLTSITLERDVILKHFVDSLSCLRSGCFEDGQEVIDVGSGAGYPGLPLQLARPKLRFTLLDATKKKVDHLSRACNVLGLQETHALWGRSEELAHKFQYREKFDVAVIRAVGSTATVLELCLPLVRVGGALVIQKGQFEQQELNGSEHFLGELGGEIEKVDKFLLPELGDQRTLITVRKIGACAKKYPRLAGEPAKKPLF